MTATDLAPAAKPRRIPNLKPHKRASIAAGLVGAAALGFVLYRGLNLDILFEQSAVIQIHVYAAVAAFILGSVLLLARKGRTFHIRAGWAWVGLMSVTAGSSLFITGLNGGWWSWIHILSGSTLFTLPFAVMAARKHKVVRHRAAMVSLYVGGMLIAGGFTFLPGRLMWEIVFA